MTLDTSKARITVVTEPEDQSVRGHYDSGDAAADREMEADIMRRLDKGDQWAFCCVKVIAELETDDGRLLRGESAWLGGCSYENEKEFRAPGGCFDDMKAEALTELQEDYDSAAQWVYAGDDLWKLEISFAGKVLFRANARPDCYDLQTGDGYVLQHIGDSGWTLGHTKRMARASLEEIVAGLAAQLD